MYFCIYSWLIIGPNSYHLFILLDLKLLQNTISSRTLYVIDLKKYHYVKIVHTFFTFKLQTGYISKLSII